MIEDNGFAHSGTCFALVSLINQVAYIFQETLYICLPYLVYRKGNRRAHRGSKCVTFLDSQSGCLWSTASSSQSCFQRQCEWQQWCHRLHGRMSVYVQKEEAFILCHRHQSEGRHSHNMMKHAWVRCLQPMCPEVTSREKAEIKFKSSAS